MYPGSENLWIVRSGIYRGSRGYGGDPRIPWESRKSRGYGRDPENPGDTVEIQRIRPGSKGYGILSICNVS
jgi:hypothetical protein